MHLLFAWRYFKAKKTTNAINVIAWISVGAIIIGTVSLILVLSVFNGFEGLVKSLYSTFYTDLRISADAGKVMTVTQAQLDQLRRVNGIRNFSCVLEERAFLQHVAPGFAVDEGPSDNQSFFYIKGVDENYRYVSGVAAHLVDSVYDLGTADAPRLVLGAGISAALNLGSGGADPNLHIYMPRKSSSEQVDPMEDISADTIHVSDIFQIQQDFDNKYGITNIGFLRRALRLPADQYSAIEIAATDPKDVSDLQAQVSRLFGKGYKVENKYQQNSSLYSVMNLERWAIYGVLCLILVVAAFTMIGALTMLVLEKQKDMHILHALGATTSFIRRIFITEGLLLALIGGGAGMLLAFVLGILQLKYHLIPLGGGSFLINYYPVQLKWADFILVAATVFVLAFIASWLPSRRAVSRDFSLRSE